MADPSTYPVGSAPESLKWARSSPGEEREEMAASPSRRLLAMTLVLSALSISGVARADSLPPALAVGAPEAAAHGWSLVDCGADHMIGISLTWANPESAVSTAEEVLELVLRRYPDADPDAFRPLVHSGGTAQVFEGPAGGSRHLILVTRYAGGWLWEASAACQERNV